MLQGCCTCRRARNSLLLWTKCSKPMVWSDGGVQGGMARVVQCNDGDWGATHAVVDLWVDAIGRRSLRAQRSGSIGGATCARAWGGWMGRLGSLVKTSRKRKVTEESCCLAPLNNHMCNPLLATQLYFPTPTPTLDYGEISIGKHILPLWMQRLFQNEFVQVSSSITTPSHVPPFLQCSVFNLVKGSMPSTHP